VGKGLTFDAGGYNIKTAMMELMKFDCGGSAAVLGAARSVAGLKPDIETHFIVASCENMINEKAMRPGDVLTASNGKTIEVLNTDAEGRLTLADALVCVRAPPQPSACATSPSVGGGFGGSPPDSPLHCSTHPGSPLR
jgi:leucyl aminopeptidase